MANKAYLKNSTLLPDEQLGCVDRLFHIGDKQAYEWEAKDSLAWNVVGTNVHWNPRIENIGMGYLRRVFGVDEASQVPPVSATLGG